MSIGEKRTLNAYYKRRFYRGRTAFARAADFIALRVILLIACYLWFSFNVESIIAAAVLTAAAVGAISVFAELVKSVRLEKFILRENARLSKKAVQRKPCAYAAERVSGHSARIHKMPRQGICGRKPCVYRADAFPSG